MKFQFEELKIKPEGNWFQRAINSPHFKKSLTFILLGAIAGFALFYFTEGKYHESVFNSEALKSAGIGGFFGFFITNSPCARGRC